MKFFLVFDSKVNLTNLATKISALAGVDEFLIFPLTDNPEAIESVKQTISRFFGNKVTVLASNRLIERAVDELAEKINALVGAAGNIKINAQKIKEHFYFTKQRISTWWFSQLAEKNTIKNQSFFKIAQIKAVAKRLENSKSTGCYLCIRDRELRQALIVLCRRCGITHIDLSAEQNHDANNLTLCKQVILTSPHPLIIFFRAAITLVVRFVRVLRARIRLGTPRQNMSNEMDDKLLVCSYFPSVTPARLKENHLENRFMNNLEPLLKRSGKKIVWLWLFVYVNNQTFSGALDLARRLVRQGETGFLLEQFTTLAGAVRVIHLWLRQIYHYLKIRRQLTDATTALFGPIELRVIFRKMNDLSFIGWQGLESILYFEQFKRAWQVVPTTKQCLHFAEMQPWEIALNMSRRAAVSCMQTIGYAHAAIAPNYFFYQRHATESSTETYDYPFDDIVAINGEIAKNLLASSSYPRVELVEATRFLYLNEPQRQTPLEKLSNTILVATSASRRETQEMITLIKYAFYGQANVTVWLKGHPTMPLNQIVKETGIDIEKSNFFIKDEPIDCLLCQAPVLIVSDSSVAIEALCLDCRVVIPVLSSWMFLSPLKGHETFYSKVYNVDELRHAVLGGLRGEKPLNPTTVKQFIDRFWCLDRSMRRWRELTEN